MEFSSLFDALKHSRVRMEFPAEILTAPDCMKPSLRSYLHVCAALKSCRVAFRHEERRFHLERRFLKRKQTEIFRHVFARSFEALSNLWRTVNLPNWLEHLDTEKDRNNTVFGGENLKFPGSSERLKSIRQNTYVLNCLQTNRFEMPEEANGADKKTLPENTLVTHWSLASLFENFCLALDKKEKEVSREYGEGYEQSSLGHLRAFGEFMEFSLYSLVRVISLGVFIPLLGEFKGEKFDRKEAFSDNLEPNWRDLEGFGAVKGKEMVKDFVIAAQTFIQNKIEKHLAKIDSVKNGNNACDSFELFRIFSAVLSFTRGVESNICEKENIIIPPLVDLLIDDENLFSRWKAVEKLFINRKLEVIVDMISPWEQKETLFLDDGKGNIIKLVPTNCAEALIELLYSIKKRFGVLRSNRLLEMISYFHKRILIDVFLYNTEKTFYCKIEELEENYSKYRKNEGSEALKLVTPFLNTIKYLVFTIQNWAENDFHDNSSWAESERVIISRLKEFAAAAISKTVKAIFAEKFRRLGNLKTLVNSEKLRKDSRPSSDFNDFGENKDEDDTIGNYDNNKCTVMFWEYLVDLSDQMAEVLEFLVESVSKDILLSESFRESVFRTFDKELCRVIMPTTSTSGMLAPSKIAPVHTRRKDTFMEQLKTQFAKFRVSESLFLKSKIYSLLCVVSADPDSIVECFRPKNKTQICEFEGLNWDQIVGLRQLFERFR